MSVLAGIVRIRLLSVPVSFECGVRPPSLSLVVSVCTCVYSVLSYEVVLVCTCSCPPSERVRVVLSRLRMVSRS